MENTIGLQEMKYFGDNKGWSTFAMRHLITVLLLAVPTPATAWEFAPGAICTLNHTEGDAEIQLTYDPRAPRYTLAISRDQPWPEAPTFAMNFDGPAPIRIATNQQAFSADGRTLNVADSGFGNVLDGLQYNTTATATLGETVVIFSLDGASGPVAKFRACDQDGLV